MGFSHAIAPMWMLPTALLCVAIGTIWYAREQYAKSPEGIKNNGTMFRSISTRGVLGWMIGILISGFYTCLYWFPEKLSGLIALFEPLSQALRGKPSDQWFVYGTFYTTAVLVMGVKIHV